MEAGGEIGGEWMSAAQGPDPNACRLGIMSTSPSVCVTPSIT